MDCIALPYEKAVKPNRDCLYPMTKKKRLAVYFLVVISIIVFVGFMMVALGILRNRVPVTEPPGLFVRLRTYLTTNTVETSPDSVFPERRPRVYSISPNELYERVEEAVEGLGWEIG